MENSKKLLKAAGILPKLRLARKKDGGGVESTGPHRVKLLEDHVIKDIDRQTGKPIEVVKYILEENGEKKEYRVPVKDKQGQLHYLVQRLGEVAEGGEVVLECKKAGIKNYIEVIGVNEIGKVEYEDEDEHAEEADPFDKLPPDSPETAFD